jgi:hypothetical protein
MSEWLLFTANSVIFQLYHGENKLIFNEMIPRSGETKDYKIDICCFSAKHTALRRKSKDWFARNQNNVSRVKLHVYPQTVVSVSYIVAL